MTKSELIEKYSKSLDIYKNHTDDYETVAVLMSVVDDLKQLSDSEQVKQLQERCKVLERALNLYARCNGCSCEYRCSFKDEDCWQLKGNISYKQKRILQFIQQAQKEIENE